MSFQPSPRRAASSYFLRMGGKRSYLPSLAQAMVPVIPDAAFSRRFPLL